MKRLYIVRHAKAIKPEYEIADIDRSLKHRGTQDSHEIGKLLASKHMIPELMITSPAIRTLSTALIFCDELKFAKEKIRLEPSLYETSVGHYLNVMQRLSDEFSSVALFGHNSIISELCSILSGLKIELPTCGIAVFDIEVNNWSEADERNSKLSELIVPEKPEH